MSGGALGYARRLLLARRMGRAGMLVTVVPAVTALLVALALGWAGSSVASIVVGVLVVGCLASCGLVWVAEARASREIENQVAALAEKRAVRAQRVPRDR